MTVCVRSDDGDSVGLLKMSADRILALEWSQTLLESDQIGMY